MDTIFLTGFPGFLARALLPRLLEERPAATAVCLVQPRHAETARTALRTLAAREFPDAPRRIRIVEGDLTREGLVDGSLPREISEVWHLAAVYDLAVDPSTARAVNVEGTRRVLEACGGLPSLQRFHHVSTCFVSGRHRGIFRETDLDVGQRFHNHYEETKYLAEIRVRNALDDGLPTTVHRPAIVVGDRGTGVTSKFDGPYHVLRLVLRQGRIALLPVPMGAGPTQVNVVPRDWVVEAMVRLAARKDTVGGTYHLAEPRPATVDEVVARIRAAVDAKVLRIPVPLGPSRWALRHLPVAARFVGMPAELLDYFVHPTTYATGETQRALGGFAPPRFVDQMEDLIRFVREHPDVGAAAMR